MDIDPRWVSTPIGAVVGVALAKKLLGKKDQTTKNLAIGAGLGGGAGFLAGQFIKGEPGDIAGAEDVPRAYTKFLKKQVPVGVPTEQEIAAVDRLRKGGIYGSTPVTGGSPLQTFRRETLRYTAPEQNAAQVYHARSVYFDRLANSGVSEQSRQAFQRAAEMNRESAREMNKALTKKTMFFGGPKAGVRTIADLISRVLSG